MKFERTEVWGFEHALRGMRNPLNSWDKGDSFVKIVPDDRYKYIKDEPFSECATVGKWHGKDVYVLKEDGEYCIVAHIGDNDMKLAKKLITGGSEHRKFLRQIVVAVDITAPLYWWKEFDTYKVGTVANSTSTMHKLATTPITMDCFELDDYEGGLELSIDGIYGFESCRINETLIEGLEFLRKAYLETKDKRYWKELIRWLPEGWLQTRTITLNYENLFTIYNQRKNHKLNEWSGLDNPENENFISWMLKLPYMREFLGIEDTKTNAVNSDELTDEDINNMVDVINENT